MKRREQQRGFALLLVLAMAGAIAMLLYMEMPRAIFEAQRSKEALLVERGEQYQRAIGLYFKKNNKWPQEIKDLEETNGIRFLRHRFIDPMTGKDEWRIIHTNGMMLTDSLVQKPQNPLTGGKDANGNPLPPGTQQASSGFGSQSSSGFGGRTGSGSGSGFGSGSTSSFGSNSSFGSSGSPGSTSGFGQPQQMTQQAQAGWPGSNPAMGAAGVPGVPGVPGQPGVPGDPGQTGPLQAWQQRRPSDRPAVPTTPGAAQPGDNPSDTTLENNENQAVFAGDPTSANLGGTGTPGQPGQNPTGQPVTPGMPYNPQAVMNPSGSTGVAAVPGTPGYPPQGYAQGQVSGQNPGGAPMPGQPGFSPQTSGMPGGMPGAMQPGPGGVPGAGGMGASQSAAQAIMQSLTQPRPGGLQGLQQGNTQGMGGGGPGMAGVASKFEGASIRVYNDRKKYQEWEFVYDMSKDPALNPQGTATQQQQQPGSVSNPGFGSFGNSGSQNQNQNSGSMFSTGSSFGQQPPQPQPSNGPP